MKITIVTLEPSADPYYTVFIDGKKFMQGDDYHDKINNKMDGIVEYLVYMKIPHEYKDIGIEPFEGEEIWHYNKYQHQENESMDAYIKRIKKAMSKKAPK